MLNTLDVQHDIFCYHEIIYPPLVIYVPTYSKENIYGNSSRDRNICKN